MEIFEDLRTLKSIITAKALHIKVDCADGFYKKEYLRYGCKLPLFAIYDDCYISNNIIYAEKDNLIFCFDKYGYEL